jgi:BRCA1-associated protein
LNEEKELNKCLASNQEIYQGKLATLEEKQKKSDQDKAAEIEDLQSQLRDVMFYLDAQSKVSEKVDSEEIQGSSMQINQQEETTQAHTSNLSNSAKMASRRKRK